jgi:hypothetical protein
MKAFAVISVARQVDGEYVVVKVEKAFKSATKAEDFTRNLSRQYTESIATPAGPMQCVCERGVFEIDVED